jgi:hypothetical protein
MNKRIDLPIGNQDQELKMIEKFIACLPREDDIRVLPFGVTGRIGVDLYLMRYGVSGRFFSLDSPTVYVYDYANIIVRDFIRHLPKAYYKDDLMKFEMIYPNAKVKSFTLWKWSVNE